MAFLQTLSDMLSSAKSAASSAIGKVEDYLSQPLATAKPTTLSTIADLAAPGGVASALAQKAMQVAAPVIQKAVTPSPSASMAFPVGEGLAPAQAQAAQQAIAEQPKPVPSPFFGTRAAEALIPQTTQMMQTAAEGGIGQKLTSVAAFLPSVVKETVLQPAARTVASLGLAATGQTKPAQPKTAIQRQLLGEEPVSPMQKNLESFTNLADEVARNQLAKAGQDPMSAGGIITRLGMVMPAALIGGVLEAANFDFGLGKTGNKAAQKLIDAETAKLGRNLTKEEAAKIIAKVADEHVAPLLSKEARQITGEVPTAKVTPVAEKAVVKEAAPKAVLPKPALTKEELVKTERQYVEDFLKSEQGKAQVPEVALPEKPEAVIPPEVAPKTRQEAARELLAKTDKTYAELTQRIQQAPEPALDILAREASEMTDKELADTKRLARLEAKEMVDEAVGATEATYKTEIGELKRKAELDMLKQRIKIRSSYEKELAERKAFLEKTVTKLKDKAANIQEKKTTLANLAKQILSKETRGKFLSAVANVKTDGEMARAVRRVFGEKNLEESRKLTQEIIKLTERADALPPNQKDRVLALLDGVSFQGMTATKAQELSGLRNFLQKNPDAIYDFGGKSFRTAERISELGNEPLREKSLTDLIDLHAKMTHLVEQGETLKRVAGEVEKLRRENFISSIMPKDGVPTVKNMDVGLPKPKTPGIKSEVSRRAVMQEAIQKGVMDFSSPDVGFKILDNEKERGPLWKAIKAPIDESRMNAVEMRNRLMERLFNGPDGVKAIEKKYGQKFTDENFERVMMHATTQQIGGKEKLLKSDPRITESYLDSLVLTPMEEEFYKLGRSIFDELRPEIDKVLRRTSGRELGKVDNYWSWQTDFDDDSEVVDRLVNDYAQTRTKQNFTKERTFAGRQRINLNALDVLAKHIADSTTFINMEDAIRNSAKLVNEKGLEKAVGTRGVKWLRSYVDLQARNGIPKGYRPSILSSLTRNLGQGLLGFKASTIVKQPLAMINAVGFIGKEAPARYAELLTSKDLREGVWKASKQQRFRAADDPAFLELSKNKKLAKWQEIGYHGVKSLDSSTADAVWYAAYRKGLEDQGLKFNKADFVSGKYDKDAAQYADLLVRRTQGSSEAKDAPIGLLDAGRKDVLSAILQFQRFTLNQAFLWRDAAVALRKEKDLAKAAGIAMGLVAAGLAESYANSGVTYITGTRQAQYKEKQKTLPERLVTSLTNNIPILSNAINAYQYGSSGIPVFDVAGDVLSGVKAALSAKSTESKIYGAIKATQSVGELAGIPGSSQAGQLARKALDYYSPTSRKLSVTRPLSDEQLKLKDEFGKGIKDKKFDFPEYLKRVQEHNATVPKHIIDGIQQGLIDEKDPKKIMEMIRSYEISPNELMNAAKKELKK